MIRRLSVVHISTKMVYILLIVGLIGTAWSSDVPCHNAGGHCQYDSGSCSGSYHSGLCSGASNRRCCIPSSGGSSSGSSSGYNCYGDVMSLHPTGRHSGGVTASHNELRYDVSTLNAHKSCYVNAGRNNCIHPAVIAALASRESHAGRLLTSTGGWGDHHNAYGVLQCDVNACPVCSHGLKCTTYNWNSCEHIDMMTKYVLVPFIKTVQRNHPSWPKAHQLQGGVAAYNFGPGNVQSWGGLDIGSTGNDYSNDVIARAQYLINHYGW